MKVLNIFHKVAQHNTKDDLWIVIKNKIFDCTKYLDYHPGGRDKLMMAAGKDGTALFSRFSNFKKFEILY